VSGAQEDGRLDERTLAERAGVDVETVRRYAKLRLLDAEEGGYTEYDVARIRLIGSCERGGLPLEGMAQAVEQGLFSFAFLDHEQYRRFGGFADTTYADAAAEVGLSFDFVRRVFEALGLPIPESEDERIRESDRLPIRLLAMPLAFGASENAIVRTVRVYGDALRRITEAESQFYRDSVEQPLVEAGMPLVEAIQTASSFGDEWNEFGDRSLLELYHRHQESVWLSGLVARIEEALEQLGVYRRIERASAMVFLDLEGYTRLTEERGDAAAAELAASLAGIAQETSRRHGGRPVKWLGDGVMFHFPDPRGSVVAALEMVERTPAVRLPPAHVGVAAGPVVMQDGDYFGRTVNLAARLSGTAGPSEVLVTTEVVEACAGDGVRFEEIGKAELKGFSAPVVVHRATRPG
jgi:adenylate cyclase